MIDYYELLGVSPDSTPDQIKLAWRESARVHHPDRGGDQKVFAQVAEAYEVLGDESRRAAYTVAWRAAKSLTCACGNAKLPGSTQCAWCGLRARQVEQQEARKAAKAKKKADREERRIAKLKQRQERKRQRQEESLRGEYDRRVNGGPTRGLGLPSADELLQAVLAEAALRSGVIDAGTDLDIRVKVDPRTGKVRLSGTSVDALRAMKRNLEQAEEVVRHLRRFRRD